MSTKLQQTSKDSLNFVNNEKPQGHETNTEWNTNFAKQYKDTTIMIPSVHKENGINCFNNGEAKGNETCSEDMERYCVLSRPLRKIMFLICLIIGLGFLIPVLGSEPPDFRAYYYLASAFFILSLLFLYGPIGYLRRVFNIQGLLITFTYLATFYGVMYSWNWLHNDTFIALFQVGQVASYICFLMVNCPGGPAWCRTLLFKIAAKVDDYLRII